MGNLTEKKKELTFPDSERLKFEIFVSAICDDAKVDYESRPFFIREYLIRLERLWRNGIGNNLDTDGATRYAFDKFGASNATVRRLKDGFRGWLYRLQFFHLYRLERYLLIIAGPYFLSRALRHGIALNSQDKTKYVAIDEYVLTVAVATALSLALCNRRPPWQTDILKLHARIIGKVDIASKSLIFGIFSCACGMQVCSLGIFVYALLNCPEVLGYGRMWLAFFHITGLILLYVLGAICFYSETRMFFQTVSSEPKQ